MTRQIKSITAGYRAFIADKTIKQDFLAPFISMTQACLPKLNNKFTVEEIQEKVMTLHKTKIPLLPMKNILHELTKRKIITKIHNRSEYKIIDVTNIEEENNLFVSEFHAFQQDFIILANECTSFWIKRYNKTYVLEDTLITLEKFLMQQSINIMGSKLDRDYSSQECFLVSSFIKEKCLGNSNYEELLIKITLGYILTESITFTVSTKENLKNTEFVLDTPFVFHLLGINPLNTQETYQETISDLLSQGAQISMFRHTLDEIETSLINAERWIDDPRIDYSIISTTLEHYIGKGKNKADIIEDRANLRNNITQYGIEIKDVDYSEHNHKYIQDEVKIYESIVEVYTQTSVVFDEEKNRQMIQTDAASINGIFIQRKGSTSADLMNCRSVLVSNNYSLSFAAQNYNNILYPAQKTFTPVITDIYLGTKLWLENPTKLSKMAMERLTAQVYASFRPTDSFWNRFLEELQKCEERGTISEEEGYLLKSTMVSGQLAMELTAGDIHQITDATPIQLRKRIEEEAKHEGILLERKRALEEAEIQKAEYAEKIKEAEKNKEDEIAKKNLEIEKTQKELMSLRKIQKDNIIKLEGKAKNRAKRTLFWVKIIYIVIVIFLCVTMYLVWDYINKNNLPDYFGFFFTTIPIVIAAIIFYIYMTTKKNPEKEKVFDRFENWIYKRAYEKFDMVYNSEKDQTTI